MSDVPQAATAAKALLKERGIRGLKSRMMQESSAGIKDELGEERTISEPEGYLYDHCRLEKPYVTGGVMIKTQK